MNIESLATSQPPLVGHLSGSAWPYRWPAWPSRTDDHLKCPLPGSPQPRTTPP